MNSYMIERIIGLIITILFAVFFGISTYALYMFENPVCYIGIPGIVILWLYNGRLGADET